MDGEAGDAFVLKISIWALDDELKEQDVLSLDADIDEAIASQQMQAQPTEYSRFIELCVSASAEEVVTSDCHGVL
eukprot:scaffold39672_cov17-Prasinocladus_malaysianus.AAC.1